MKGTFEKVISIIGITMIALIIFVRSGEKTTVSGGQQTATILNSFFGGLKNTINALTGAD